ICSYVNFKYERLTLFCFFCGWLGHSDSFCHSNMELGFEAAEMGWNLSLRAQSKKTLAMNSVWLRDDGDEIQRSSIKGREFGRCNWEVKDRRCSRNFFNLILRVNLEGNLNWVSDVEVGSSKIHEQIDMEHDGEDGAIEGGDGKKRPRREDDRSLVGEEISAIIACPRCEGAAENVEHLLRECPVTREEIDECENSKLTKEIVHVEWCPPNGSDIKVNFDAAFDEAQATSASGVVVRNASGEILSSKTVVYRAVASPFTAKAHACLQVVLLRKEKGFTSVIIEWDSVSVIKNSQSDLNIPRSAIIMAHELAREAIRNGSRTYLLGGLLERDAAEDGSYKRRESD
ncbi:hypothetical protein Gotri_023802, partial [Gossypium trilobum]|nr:hypothetical protein [Gossypium trilobum]